MKDTANSIEFNRNMAAPQSALWYPMGQIKVTSTTFYWTFTIRQIGTSATSVVAVGLSDLKKMARGWEAKGLYYNGPNLSDGSGLLIGKIIVVKH